MSITLLVGRKGKLKRSGREFEILVAGPGNCTTIRFRGERTKHEVKDTDLREWAEEIPDWSPSREQ